MTSCWHDIINLNTDRIKFLASYTPNKPLYECIILMKFYSNVVPFILMHEVPMYNITIWEVCQISYIQHLEPDKFKQKVYIYSKISFK